MVEEKCETCKFFYPVVGHPWVDGNPMSKTVAHVCTLFSDVGDNTEKEGRGRFVLSRPEHSCEMHTKIKGDNR